MEFQAQAGASRRARTDCAVVGVHERGELTGEAIALDRALGGRLARILKAGDFAGRLGEALLIPDLGTGPAARVVLVGLGSRKSWGRRSYRRALLAAAQAVLRCAARDAWVTITAEPVPDVDAYYRARFVAEAFGQAAYKAPALKSARKPPAPRLASVRISVAERAELSAARRGLEHGAAIAVGCATTRDLANLPANVCTPSYLAKFAKGLARSHRRIRTRVLGEVEMKRLGMGSLLSVTAGTDEPARLISTASAQTAPINVVAIVAACENMPSGRATKPGDIVRSMSGQTIEVLNTDAEGRLILCDALTYSRRFKPRLVIDVATLTGACVVALGAHNSAVMSNDDALADGLVAAGRRAADTCWRMPLAEEYSEQLKSNFADFANVGGRDGGAVTAACFLWKFVDGLKWAHLDIAGTAYQTGAAKGATGRPVPLLVDFLLSA
jgi:leucyl aminopeptidase